MAKNRLSDWFSWLLKETVLKPVAAWIGAGLIAFFSPAMALWYSRGATFFSALHEVPGWAISVTLGLNVLAILFLVYVLVRVRSQTVKQQRQPIKVFSSFGLEWLLGPDFWGTYEYSNVDELSREVLRSAIRGPVCPKCKQDVTQEFSNYISYPPGGPDGWCSGCGLMFGNVNISMGQTVTRGIKTWSEMDWLRRDVYVKAQAAARRNEL